MELRRLLFICLLMLAFLTGFLSCYIISSLYINTESPFLISFAGIKQDPGNWISEDNIEILNDRVIIYINNAVLSKYADTGSMLPTLGQYTNGIKVKPSSPEQIEVGDIISYKEGNSLIVHRVIGKGEDEKGVFFVTKGDNNQETDGKIYFEDVRYVTIGLIY